MFPIHICKEKVIYFLSRANNVANVTQTINYLIVSAHNLVPSLITTVCSEYIMVHEHESLECFLFNFFFFSKWLSPLQLLS